MHNPYFLITSISGKSVILIDRRTQEGIEIQAMRERLIKFGCTQQEITKAESELVIKNEKNKWIWINHIS